MLSTSPRHRFSRRRSLVAVHATNDVCVIEIRGKGTVMRLSLSFNDCSTWAWESLAESCPGCSAADICAITRALHARFLANLQQYDVVESRLWRVLNLVELVQCKLRASSLRSLDGPVVSTNAGAPGNRSDTAMLDGIQTCGTTHLMASRIQATWRGFLQRRCHVRAVRPAVLIQRAVRTWVTARAVGDHP